MSYTAVTQLDGPPTAVYPERGDDHRSTRTLVVGTGERAAELTRALVSRGHRVVGAVDRQRLPNLVSVPWLGPSSQLGAVALAHAVDEICVALPLRSSFDDWLHASSVGRELGIPVSFHFDLLGDAECVRLAPLMGATLLRCNLHPTSLGIAPRLKRVTDVVGASVALLLFAPLLLGASLAIKLTSPGPVFFRQPRVGRGRRVFQMLKLRTMVQDAEARRADVQGLNDATGIMFKINSDPRLTSVGPFLRRTSIDELPQLINVLKGEMSLIGPRPIPTWVFEQIDEPRFHRRFSVLPGLTGLWQVHGRPQEYPQMVYHDLRYVDEWSFWLDLKVLVRTIPAVLHRKGAA